MRERIKKPEYTEKPQNNGDHNDTVQNRFNRSLHRYESVDQPKQNPYNDQDRHYLY
jgi:hypothetical protein